MNPTNQIKKIFRLSLSKKFRDGSIVTLTLGTELEESNVDPEELFVKTMQSTFSDLQTAIKKDELSKAILKSVKRNLALERKVEKALEDAED